ncbi:MAG: hypothetical protein ACOCQ6_02155 [Bacteroidota bacterium]
MKRLVYSSLILLWITILTGCFDDFDEETGIKKYPVTEDIINPPDSFLVLMPLTDNLNVRTFLRTENNAVWHIQKMNALSSRVWIKRAENDSSYLLEQSDTIGIQENILYELYGNNNNYPEDRILQLRFEKIREDYETFPNKI